MLECWNKNNAGIRIMLECWHAGIERQGKAEENAGMFITPRRDETGVPKSNVKSFHLVNL